MNPTQDMWQFILRCTERTDCHVRFVMLAGRSELNWSALDSSLHPAGLDHTCDVAAVVGRVILLLLLVLLLVPVVLLLLV